MAKNSKSRRFTQHGSDTVKKHDERFPYRSSLSEAIEEDEGKDNQTVGGF